MLTEICHELRNWFIKDRKEDIKAGKFKIVSGSFVPPFAMAPGQYYRIYGSIFNDGVHRWGDAEDILTDEEFTGTIWRMYIPREVLELDQEITAWNSTNGAASGGPYVSEGFGGYTYTKKTAASGGAYTWADEYRARLNRWRKL